MHPRSLLTFFLIIMFLSGSAQVHTLVVRKHARIDQQFWQGSRFTFQTIDGRWHDGFIEKFTRDSVYYTRLVLIYGMGGIDTQRFSGANIALAEIYALPTKKEMVVNKNGIVKIIPGHEKYMWVRNGFIFRVIGAGFALINVTNSLIDNDPPFAGKNAARLGVAAAVFAVGQILKMRYRVHRKIGSRYTLEVLDY